MRINKYYYFFLFFISSALGLWILVYLIGQLWQFSNTGAEWQEKFITQDIVEIGYNTPIEIENMLPEHHPNDIILEKIKLDYAFALSSLEKSNQHHFQAGIQNHFIDSFGYEIFNNFKNSNQLIHHKQYKGLKHKINILFFSRDAHFIVFLDSIDCEYNRLETNNKIVNEEYSKSVYNVFMKLDNGFWKIIHRIKVGETKIEKNRFSPLVSSPSFVGLDSNYKLTLDQQLFTPIGINYYPQAHPWHDFWPKYSKKQIEKDLKLIKNSGFNSIRIFIPFYPNRFSSALDTILPYLDHFLFTTSKYNLKVIPTFFDFYSSYAIEDWSICSQYTKRIVNRYKNEPAILAWDIKNEPDLDFENAGEDKVNSWLSFIISEIKEVDSFHMVTIGWSALKYAHLHSENIDLLSPHFYLNPILFEKEYQLISGKLNSKPLIIGEYGTHSYNSTYFPDSKTQEEQAFYISKLHKAFEKSGINGRLIWTLFDFSYIPNEVVGKSPWKKSLQKNFGLIDSKGNFKLSYYEASPNKELRKKKTINQEKKLIRYTYSILFSIGFVFLFSIAFFKAKKKSK